MVTIGSSKKPEKGMAQNQKSKRDEEIIFSEEKEEISAKDASRKRRYDRPKKRED